jgi:6-phosphogluconolactonase
LCGRSTSPPANSCPLIRLSFLPPLPAPARGISHSIPTTGSSTTSTKRPRPQAAATLKQKVPTLPGYAGTNFTSEIVVAPGGRFLYVGNRLHNSIGIFAIAADGRVRWIGEEWTRGDYPRNIALDTSGSFLVACNHHSDQVTVFRVDRATGRLGFTEQ